MKKRGNKRGQGIFGMSFSTIFSIFIIIFIISVAIWAITHFVGLWKCSAIGLYYDDLREEVRDAWSGTTGWYQDSWTGEIPKEGLFGTGIEYVCFGRLSADASSVGGGRDWTSIKTSLIDDHRYIPTGTQNVFMYPPDKACAKDLGAITLRCDTVDCVTTEIDIGGTLTEKFFCVPIEDNEATVWMVKSPTQTKITLLEDSP